MTSRRPHSLVAPALVGAIGLVLLSVMSPPTHAATKDEVVPPERSGSSPLKQVPSKNRPQRMAVALRLPEWDIEKCVSDRFQNVAQKMEAVGVALPDETSLYCSVDWKTGALSALDKQVSGMRFQDEPLPWGINQRGADDILARPMLGPNQDVVRLRRLYRLLGILLLARDLQGVSVSIFARMLGGADIMSIATLRQLATQIDWQKPLSNPNNYVFRIRLHRDPDIYITTDRNGPITPEVIGEYGRATLVKIDKAYKIPVLRGLDDQGSFIAMAGLASVYRDISAELYEGQRGLRGPAWKVAPTGDSLEIYHVTALSGPVRCSGVATGRAVLYCQADNRIFITGQPKGSGLKVGQQVFPYWTPELLHELAHYFLNPVDAEERPFISEAIAMVLGEKEMRGMEAGLANANGEQVAAALDVLAGRAGIASGQAADIDKKIADRGYTNVERAALCAMAKRPIEEAEVLRWNSMSAASFQAQRLEDLRRAYYTAWALQAFGDRQDYGGLLGSSAMRSLIAISNTIIDNQSPTEAQKQLLANVIVGTQQRIELAKGSAGCKNER